MTGVGAKRPTSVSTLSDHWRKTGTGFTVLMNLLSKTLILFGEAEALHRELTGNTMWRLLVLLTVGETGICGIRTGTGAAGLVKLNNWWPSEVLDTPRRADSFGVAEVTCGCGELPETGT
ncbi:hypothetical protein ElyMa_004871300 [Elysia marginata]|uniref:Uncharacterized protein n=1 Tax=Elysia marginata TaxID=1093978 RepID=A0AAV4ISK8_9GAST|nr:hypothetical protein ElyMa_004871300 [Elysia marginata]